MRKFTYFVFIILVAALTGCGPSRDKSVSRITSLENRLFAPSASSFDKAKADSLQEAY
jgi:hypothetical protein